MTTSSRRTFLKQTSTMAAAATVSTLSRKTKAASANERIVMGLIGPGGLGLSYLKLFLTQPDVEMAYICDVDEHRLGEALKIAETAGAKPKAVKDMRRIFDDKS